MATMDRSRPLSVPEVATALQASAAYVRRLLIRGQLFGTKVGPVWAVYPEDLEAFLRLRRPPGRPRKAVRSVRELETRLRIDQERNAAGTDGMLRKGGRG
jgi:excisionase family DNA binding protein